MGLSNFFIGGLVTLLMVTLTCQKLVTPFVSGAISQLQVVTESHELPSTVGRLSDKRLQHTPNP